MLKITKDQFFSFFQQRLANIKQLEQLPLAFCAREFASFNPELNILLSVELDALAKYWDLNTNKPRITNSGTRLGEFLARHGDSAIWTKCSHVDLLRRATREESSTMIKKRRGKIYLADRARQSGVLDSVLRKVLAPSVFVPTGVLRWYQDPSFDFLSAYPDIQAAGISPDWLRRSRYGEMIYCHHRSAWVHALEPRPGVGN